MFVGYLGRYGPGQGDLNIFIGFRAVSSLPLFRNVSLSNKIMSNEIKKESVTLVRVYTDEGDSNVSSILKKLHQLDDVVGATIFRVIAGFGDRGTVHQASLLDIASDLPIVIEFYHKEDNCDAVIRFIHAEIKNAHIICWPVNLSFEHVN